MDLIEGIKTNSLRRDASALIFLLWEMDLIEGIKTQHWIHDDIDHDLTCYEKWTW